MSKPNDSVPNKLTPIEMELIIDDLIRILPYQIRYHAQLSKLYKARFDSLVAAGFPERQALEIVKARGLD